jgi:hypothetical protein
METLLTIYPTVADLLATPPEDVAVVLLKLAKGTVQNGMFWPETVNNVATGTDRIISTLPARYPPHNRQQMGCCPKRGLGLSGAA